MKTITLEWARRFVALGGGGRVWPRYDLPDSLEMDFLEVLGDYWKDRAERSVEKWDPGRN